MGKFLMGGDAETSMHALGAAPHGAGTGARLITRRHIDYCRTSSAVCPSEHA
jgi:hypothetical protein